MRVGTQNFELNNSLLSKEPRYVVEQAYDPASTDLVYFTSHADCATPASAVVYPSSLKSLSVTSQRIKPEAALASIGSASYSLLNKSNQIRTLHATKLSGGSSLKEKRVAFYVGYKGDAWSDYQLVQTQIVDDVKYLDGSYDHQCSDVQRFERKDIFALVNTTLASSLLKGETTIQVYDTSAFEMVAHGTSYSDAPSSTVGYVKIDDEVIRYTGKTSATFTGCTRGALNTREVDHVINTSASADRRTEVEEHIYLEMPIAKLMYALLTGSLYNQASSLPSTWSLNVDTAYIKTSDFINIGGDFWDPADDTKGLVVRFEGVTKTDGKKFIETELGLLMAGFNPIYSDGSLGLKRAVHIISDASPSVVLDETNIVSYSALTHDMGSVKNDISIEWNYDAVKEKSTRIHTLYDTESISLYGKSKQHVINFKGLHGSIHTSKTIDAAFDRLRDRYAAPPLLLNLRVLFHKNAIEVGDVVRVKLDQIQDYNSDSSLDRAFEVQSVSVDWTNGYVNLSLFGSAAKPGTIDRSEATTTLPDTWYESEGTDIAGLAGVVAGHITADLTLVGGDDLNDPANIYYSTVALTVDAGVNLYTTGNVQLRVPDFITVNGNLSGNGLGLSGKNPVSGFVTDNQVGLLGNIGVTKPQAYISVTGSSLVYATSWDLIPPAIGDINAVPEYNISYDSDSDTLLGLPSALRGTSGGAGGNVLTGLTTLALGGAGGNSGSGLVIICRGITTGGAGLINLGGQSGEIGQSTTYQNNVYYAGTGAGGAGGGLLVLLDGSSALYTADYASVQGRTQPVGEALQLGSYSIVQVTTANKTYSSPHRGIDNGDHSQANLRVQYIPALATPAIDIPLTTVDAISVVAVEYRDTPNSAAGNLSSIEITVTPPSDDSYDYSNIYYKLTSQSVWTFAGTANDERVITVASDGLSYDIEARAVSINGVENANGVTTSITTTDVTTPELNTDIAVVDTLVVPNVSGLELFELGNIAEFTGKDAKFAWNKSSTTNSYFIGSEPTGLGSNSGGLDLFFLDFEVRIYNDAGDELRIENVTDNFYTYTHEKNAEDYARINNAAGANRSFNIKVYNRSRQGHYSVNAAILPVNNPAPELPTGISLKPNFRSLFLEYILPDDLDFAGVKIWIDISTGFTRDDTTLVYNGVGSNVIIDVLGDGSALEPNTIYYVYMLAYDAFGETGTESVELSATTLYVDTADIKPLAVTDAQIFSLSAGKILADVVTASLVMANSFVLTTLGVIRSAATFGGTGIWLGWDVSAYKFYVGNGAKKFLKFDGSDVILGAETKITGSFSYDSEALYYHTYFDSIDGWSVSSAGGGSSATTPSGLQIIAGSGATTNFISLQRILNNPIASINYSSDIRFKTKLGFGGGNVGSPYFDGWLSVGSHYKSNSGTRTGSGFGFELRGTSSIFCFVQKQPNNYAVEITSMFGTTGNGIFKLEAIFDMDLEECRFYVDDVLKVTITKVSAGTSWPTATNDLQVFGVLLNTDNVSYSKSFDLDEVRVISEN